MEKVVKSSSLMECRLGTDVCDKTSLPSMARMRWKILSEVMASKSTTTGPQLASVRRFQSFGLIALKDIDDNNGYKRLVDEWLECRLWNRWTNSFDVTVVDIRLLAQKTSINELANTSDNTGNVCLWPSEECLSYYCYENRRLFTDKTVLELGGGMTCLSALVTAVFSSPQEVILTDGNQRGVANVETIVDRNRRRLQCVVNSRRLQWGEESHFKDLFGRIDVILCSDCLYFDESRHQLVDTIYKLLKSTGIAILLAPKRGSTFDKFVHLAKDWFEVKIIENYDQLVYKLHKTFVDKTDSHYIPDLHFPIMIELRHKNNA